MDTDKGLYHATPQTKGVVAHEQLDDRIEQELPDDLYGLAVYSDRLGVMGKIDHYNVSAKRLIEYKNNLKQIFRGQLYQLWAQYFCMIEMGFEINAIGFYELSSGRFIPVDLPDSVEWNELNQFIARFKNYNPEDSLKVNVNKCIHCIYCNLCDKSEVENVY